MALGQADPGIMFQWILVVVAIVCGVACAVYWQNEKRRDLLNQQLTADPSYRQVASLYPAQDAGSDKSALKVFEF